MLQHYIFDFDGTIADTFSIIRIFADKVSDKFNLPKLSDEHFELARKKGAKELIKLLEVHPFKIPFLVGEFRSIIKGEIANVESFPGIPEVLRTLKKEGKTLGIVTGNSTTNVKEFLKKHDIELFDFIHSEKDMFGKHRVLNRIIKQKDLDKAKTIYIGDEVRDIEASRKSGIKVASVTWGYNDEELLKENNPDFIITKPEQLLKLN